MGPPTFDFEGSLVFAGAIAAYAGTLRTSAGERGNTRTTSLDAWQGAYGDDHRLRAELEDLAAEATAEAMEQCAKDWAEAWRQAVDDMNDYAYDQAVKAQTDYDDEQGRIWAYQYFYWLEDETGTYSLPPRPTPGVVHKPVAAWAPLSPYVASGSWFAHYERSGNDMVANYQTGPAY